MRRDSRPDPFATSHQAIADYEVLAHGDALTLLNARSPDIVALSNNARVYRTWNHEAGFYNSSLAGIAMLSSSKWESHAAFSREHDTPIIYLEWWGEPAVTYQKYDYEAGTNKDTGCANFMDPREDILEDLNTLMFYTGYMAGVRTTGATKAWFVSQLESGLEANPIVTGHLHGHHNIYATNLR